MEVSSSMVEYLVALQDALGGHYGELSRPQLRLMMKLRGAAPTVSELAERLNISSPGVTQMIDKLQARGFVTRYSPDKDQRIVRVTITELGRDTLKRAELLFAQRVNEIMTLLSVEQRETLEDLLKTLFYDSQGKKMTD
jgi:DNA-binding MarR family transcriptional regulator